MASWNGRHGYASDLASKQNRSTFGIVEAFLKQRIILKYQREDNIMMYSSSCRPLFLCLCALFVAAVTSTSRMVAARPMFLVDHPQSHAGMRRMLLGIFDGWQKDETVPDYSSETIQHGVGGHVTVDKTNVYSDKEYDPETGDKTKVVSKLTGSASGKEEQVEVDLSFEQQQNNEYLASVDVTGKEASGSIDQKTKVVTADETATSVSKLTGSASESDVNDGKVSIKLAEDNELASSNTLVENSGEEVSGSISQTYQVNKGEETIKTESAVTGSALDTSEDATLQLGTSVVDCGSSTGNCAGAALNVVGEDVSGDLNQSQEYTNQENGNLAKVENQGAGETSNPTAGQQEVLTGVGTGLVNDDPTATGVVNMAGTGGVLISSSTTTDTAVGK